MVGGTTTVPPAIALLTAVVTAVTLAALGLRLGTLTVIPRLVAAAATAVFAEVKAAVFVIATGEIAPLEVTAETGTESMRAAKVEFAFSPLLFAIVTNNEARMSPAGVGFANDGGVGTAKRLMFAGRPKVSSVRDAPSAIVAALIAAGGT
jgi:hypothetical protein